MGNERVGPWRQVSICTECGKMFPKELKWMDGFFVPACPSCGEFNSPLRFDGIFTSATARRVTSRWGRLVRWEFKNPDRVAKIRADAKQEEASNDSE